MKKVLIIAPYYSPLDSPITNRTNQISQFLYDAGYDVELITTNFNHANKQFASENNSRKYKLTMLPVVSYKTNISVRRIFSIISFKIRLKKHLISKDKVDVVYCFVPPHSIAKVAKKYSIKHGSKFVIDVRDLWPEAFRMIIKSKLIHKLLFWNSFNSANKVYQSADLVISVSESYIKRVLSVLKKQSTSLHNKTWYKYQGI